MGEWGRGQLGGGISRADTNNLNNLRLFGHLVLWIRLQVGSGIIIIRLCWIRIRRKKFAAPDSTQKLTVFLVVTKNNLIQY